MKLTPRRARWIGRIGSCFLRAYGGTWRIRSVDGPPTRLDDHIFVFPHGDLLMPAAIYRDTGVVVLISQHRDGEVIAQVAERLGFSTVRGSSTRGGARATLELLRNFADRGWVITPDGPRGPRETVHPGVIHLASRSGRSIVPVGLAVSRAARLSSWDRFAIPAPFARVVAKFADPMAVASDLPRPQMETAAAQLADRMRASREEAERILAAW